jgi:hypothetical protein
MKQGCLLVSMELIANPEIFDVLLDEFILLRQIEVVDVPDTCILLVENPNFLDANEGDYLPFYEPILQRENGMISIGKIGAPYIHSKYFIKCQNKQEPPKKEDNQESLIWTP